MKQELLVPVGSMKHLEYAIFNGCDAVYLGGLRFGARAYASNFNEEEMVKAISFCHLYDVKIYVTVNTMIYEREMKEALEYIAFLYEKKVDAVIVSDLGLIYEIRNRFPYLDIHVSTQAHTGNINTILFLKKLGVTRVVLDREMSLDEIKALPPILEYEVFIHGALCVSYSGECLMSALNEVRSGNRGTCAQYCRMKYRLLKDGKYINTLGEYLLSTKELNTSSNIRKLKNSNITSFKIEGRMKSIEYVGFITKYYRTLLDHFDEEFLKKEEKNLKMLFSREFTDGYLFKNKNIMNFKTQNHVGVLLGKVIKVTKKRIKILLQEELTQEDGIKFLPSDKGMIVNFMYDESGKLIHHAKKNEVIYVENKISLLDCECVHKTKSTALLASISNLPIKKIPIQMRASVKLDNFCLTVLDEKRKVTMTENICERARKNPTTKEEIIKQLSKLKNTCFTLEFIQVELEDNLFIVVSQINEIRRKCIQKLIEMRENNET